MSGVADPKLDPAARLTRNRRLRVISQPDCQYALVSLHRLIRVGTKVDHQVHGERGIRPDRCYRFPNLGTNLDARRSERGKQGEAVGNHGSQIDERELYIAEFSAKSQNLLDHVLCTLCRRQNALEVRPRRTRGRQVLERSVSEENDGHEHIVEFMSDAARERTHGLETLAVPQLLLQLLSP